MFCVLGVFLLQALAVQSQSSCEGESCYPATGDLLIGRENQLTATSTCGSDGVERYCIVSHLQDDKKCFYCDSRNPWKKIDNENSHLIENIVTSFDVNRKNKWWQSMNGVHDVSVKLDLEAMFHFTHLVMTFKTFRPAAMIVERSSDFGQTWNTYRYFSYDCDSMFPGVKKAPLRRIADVVCEERYSNVEPSTDGEVIFRVLPPHIQSQISDPYSDEVQNLIKITNLRINFTRLHTLGDVLLDTREEITEKYYYALYDMVVRGSCHCYGHADRCIPIEGNIEGVQIVSTNPHQVFGNCACKHNTEGLNCERCKPFHNDQPWRPAHGVKTYECKLCNCNQHAAKCHFDAAVYEQTGRISGGVCDDCTHNTMGRNCEQCLPFYYMDPTRDIRDPNICLPCDCDPNGSEMGGECESRTDSMMNLEAGRCLCKRYVSGQRCDACMNGHWNLRSDNPDGCEACTCDTLGTIGNQGCDKQTGNCICKRLVTGRSCDECYDNYYGLSDDPEGCLHCDCNPGGSYSMACDKITGQCPCRPNIFGRRCDTVEPGYFITHVDYLLYEAEDCQMSGVVGAIEERVQPSGVTITWTGSGFVRVTEGSVLEFTVDNIPYSGNIELLIRYEPLLQASWENVRITLVRPREVDTSSICGNTIPSEDELIVSLSSTNRYRSTYPSVFCLERGERYIIRLAFESLIIGQSRPDAVIRIDSIALLPQPVNLPPFSDVSRLDQWEYYSCMDPFYRVNKQELQRVCEELLFIMSAITYDGGIDCGCDSTGSTSSICEAFGGQCSCKPNVIGRTCNQCSPGTFGFGPSGCTACECNTLGSRAAFCDSTGKCPCLPNVCGRNCDSCCSGHYNFPDCPSCTCNGHATECDAVGGACLNCRDNTDDFNCNRCLDGFFGDPRIGSGQRCQACMCPGGVQRGIQHADTCYLDNKLQTVICNCYTGFDGIRCDRCANNYFGDPSVGGVGCGPCDCNGNTDFALPGNCMPETGECTNCLYNSAGPRCEICASNFYGDALLRTCRACVCNALGKDRTVCDLDNNCGICDGITGQCPCLPNVLGRQCDRCDDNYWHLASGMGCEACNCCAQGSVSLQCNQYDGQCHCKDGFGGLDCCSCQDLYYGDPIDANIGCTPCECNRGGSDIYQCSNDGTCVCRERVTGAKCDRCAIGTKGNFPDCEPCGECYDNWYLIIQDLRIDTDLLIAQASNRSSNFTSGAFGRNFTVIEKNMQEIRDILDGFKNNPLELNDYEDALRQIQKDLESNADDLKKISEDLVFVDLDNEDANNRIDQLNASAIGLGRDIKKLEEDLRNLTRIDIEEALKIIYESRDRANAAQAKADGMLNTVMESTGIRQEVEEKIAQLKTQFNRDLDDYRARVDGVGNNIQDLERRIVGLNEKVCGSPGDSCGQCGGAGCGTCGGLGCSAALQIATQAKERAQLAQDLFAQKEIDANVILEAVKGAEGESKIALEEAQKAYDAALTAKEDLGSVGQNLSRLVDDIINSLNDVNGATPHQVEVLARDTLSIQISLTPDEITALAEEIQELVDSLDNIEQILNDTRDDLRRVTELEKKADETKQFAESVKAAAEYVNTALDQAKEDQKEASDAIETANADIREAKGSLTAIEAEVDAALIKANGSLTMVRMMKESLTDLSFRFSDNKNNIRVAADSANTTADRANTIANETEVLQKSFDTAKQKIDIEASNADEFRRRADALLGNATLLENETKRKLNRLRALDTDFTNNKAFLEEHESSLEALKIRAQAALTTIQERVRHYEDCN